jgi:hypothetical protein
MKKIILSAIVSILFVVSIYAAPASPTLTFTGVSMGSCTLQWTPFDDTGLISYAVIYNGVTLTNSVVVSPTCKAIISIPNMYIDSVFQVVPIKNNVYQTSYYSTNVTITAIPSTIYSGGTKAVFPYYQYYIVATPEP